MTNRKIDYPTAQLFDVTQLVITPIRTNGEGKDTFYTRDVQIRSANMVLTITCFCDSSEALMIQPTMLGSTVTKATLLAEAAQ